MGYLCGRVRFTTYCRVPLGVFKQPVCGQVCTELAVAYLGLRENAAKITMDPARL